MKKFVYPWDALSILCYSPYALLLILSFPILEQRRHSISSSHMTASPISLKLISDMSEYLCQTMMNMWLMSFPIWLIFIMFIIINYQNMLKKRLALVLMGFAGQGILFLLAYNEYLKWH